MYVVISKWTSGSVGIMSLHSTKQNAEEWAERYQRAHEEANIDYPEKVKFVVHPYKVEVIDF
jgi:hypothetical protein